MSLLIRLLLDDAYMRGLAHEERERIRATRAAAKTQAATGPPRLVPAAPRVMEKSSGHPKVVGEPYVWCQECGGENGRHVPGCRRTGGEEEES